MNKALTIWKYPLKAQDVQELVVPQGARFLSVQGQRDDICIWCLVDSLETATDAWRIHVVPTGRPCSRVEHTTLLGTVQLEDGALVFHVFRDNSPVEY
jgi:hypothetical protein